jgi:hypothetical protein
MRSQSTAFMAAIDRPFMGPSGEAGVDTHVTGDGAGDASVEAVPSPTTIVLTSTEPWGPNCPRGGVKIVVALDLNGDRAIDSSDETLGEQFVCNVYPASVSLGHPLA